MEPRAKQGIDILFPASVKYSLNLMTDEQTESTIERRRKKGKFKWIKTHTHTHTLVTIFLDVWMLGYFAAAILKWRHYILCYRRFDVSFDCKRLTGKHI